VKLIRVQRIERVLFCNCVVRAAEGRKFRPAAAGARAQLEFELEDERRGPGNDRLAYCICLASSAPLNPDVDPPLDRAAA